MYSDILCNQSTFLLLVVSLHTGQTLIFAMTKVGVLLRVTVATTSCVLTLPALLPSIMKEEVTEAGHCTLAVDI